MGIHAFCGFPSLRHFRSGQGFLSHFRPQISLKTQKLKHLYDPSIDQVSYDEYELRAVYAAAGLSRQPRLLRLRPVDQQEHKEELKADLREFQIILGTLRRNEILRVVTKSGGVADTFEHHVFTELGFAFVGACRKPEKTDAKTDDLMDWLRQYSYVAASAFPTCSTSGYAYPGWRKGQGCRVGKDDALRRFPYLPCRRIDSGTQ